MSDSELRELADDIKTNGLAHAIVRDVGMILDGRNRLAACEIAGVEPRFEEYTGDDPVAYVISANIHRRHLTTDQKREVIAKLLAANPEKSNRWLAAPLGVDDKTVASVPRDLEQLRKIPQLKKTICKDGKKRTTQRKKTKPPAVESLTIEIARSPQVPATVPVLVHDAPKGDASARALAEFKFACKAYLPKMNEAHRQDAVAFACEFVLQSPESVS